MRTAGFTFIRNALLYDYPVVEAIKSVLPLCQHFVVAVGRSDDDTLDLVRGINDPRIQIIETVWDDNLRAGGRVLAVETDKALRAIPAAYDWCFYIQADECIHEAEYAQIKAGMEQYLDDPQTEGFLFKYRHFYGSYDYTGASRRWYRREVRIVRNNPHIYSYRDAQGFRKNTGIAGQGPKKLRVRLLDAHIHHYGWVKHPEAQLRKQLNFNKLWHVDDPLVTAAKKTPSSYEYDGREALTAFTGSHPLVMLPRISAQNWKFEGDPTAVRLSWKHRFSNAVENLSGWRPFEYRNYILLP
jgi:hypothetical protein